MEQTEKLVFGLTGGTSTGRVLHMEDADSMRKGDVSICRMEDDSDVFPHIGDEDILLHMEDTVDRVGDEGESLHMEDAASCVVCRSFRKEDETDGCRGEDPL